jgi:hypothetical protein
MKLIYILLFFGIIIDCNVKTLSQSKNPVYPESFQGKIVNWQTLFEKSGFLKTEKYNETIKYFNKIANRSDYVKVIPFGITPQGRNLYYVIASKDKAFTVAKAKKIKKPIIFIENGIHAGEIEGKDASMILLRELLISKEKEDLLKNVTLIIIPVFNADGHERSGKYNRINQNGPEEMGWRTTAQNINLNRDWMKAEAPEMQAMLKLITTWMPDFLVDTHTTDGADYQYTITYAMEKFENMNQETAGWIKNKFIPFMEKKVEAAGYLVAPYLEFKDNDFNKGIVDWAATPRFSQGYWAIQNRPGLLIETHMLKPYKDRVYSTKAMLEAVIEYANEHPKELIELNKRADENTIKLYSEKKAFLPVTFKKSDEQTTFHFKGMKSVIDSSWISGGTRTTYTGEKFESDVPFYNKIIAVDSVQAPKGYLIPQEWVEIINRMKLHGIKINRLNSVHTYHVKKYKFRNVELAHNSYENRQIVKCDYDEFADSVQAPKGTYIVYTNQRTIRVILNLLEPKSDDSFLKWGFFNSIFERKEYFEPYVMEKYALQMIKDDPSLKTEFENRLNTDEKFRNSPMQRLNFFYERSPFYDKQYNVYPVMRVE